MAALAVFGTGCETDSWFDQSRLGNHEATPRVQPIIDTISIIEGDKQTDLPIDHVRPEDLIPETREYVIGPGDTVLVTIYELRIPGVDDQQQRRVTETGEVRLAIVGNVVAAGRSPSQLEKDIARKLDEDNKLRNATVSVQLIDSRQNTYSVISQSSPGGTTAGNGSPSSACSLRTDAGTHQCGSRAFWMTFAEPIGVSQPTRPMPIG